MPQPRRATGGATTEKQIPSLANNGYFSDYYLAHRLDAGLSDLYARWDELDKQGEPNERTRVRNLTVPFGTYRADAALTAPDADLLDAGTLDLGDLHADAKAALLALNDAILTALGWAPDRDADPLTLTTGEKTRHRSRRPHRDDPDRRAARRARHRLRDRPGPGHRNARPRRQAVSSNRFCSTTSRPPVPHSKQRSSSSPPTTPPATCCSSPAAPSRSSTASDGEKASASAPISTTLSPATTRSPRASSPRSPRSSAPERSTPATRPKAS